MARLCVAPGCRSKALLAEFGETGADCGNCDHCRGVFAAPRRAKAVATGLRVAALSWMTGFWDGAGGSEDLGTEETPPAAVEEAGLSPEARGHALTVTQERLLRELFASRLALARARGTAPRRIAGDDALTALACGDSGDAALKGVEPRDAQVFLALLARSRQN
jgi:ATP-dependent DNA helicase RecQ